MADIRDPFAKPNPSAGRDLVSRPNFTIPGADTPQMSAARPAPDSVMPSRPTGRDLVTRPNFTMGGKAPLPMVDEVVRAPTQPVSPTVRDPKFATRPLSPEAQQFRSTMFQGPKTPPGWVPPNPAAAAPNPAMPSTGGLRRAAFGAGQTAGKVKDWAVGTANPNAKGVLGKTADTASRGAKALGRVAGAVNLADSFTSNVKGMSNVFGSDDATISDKLAAGVEGAGNIVGTGMLSFSNKIPTIGPMISSFVGPNPASRLADTTDDSVLAKFNPNAGFGKTRAEQLITPTPTAEQATATRPGIRPFTPNEGGRGAGFKDPRVVADPATSLRKDFSGELAGVPQNLPSGLEDGRVYKTKDANGRTVYSGRNVRENAGIVDGRGGLRGYLGGGNPEPTVDAQGNRLDGRLPAAPLGTPTVIGAQPPAAQNVVQAGASPSSFGLGGADAAVSQARQAAADRGDWDAVAGSYGRGGFAGMQPQQARQSTPQGLRMDPASNKQVLSMIEQMARSPRARDRNAAAQLLADLNKAQDRNAVELQGQQTSADTSRYASDNSLRGQVYSADSSANTQLSVKQMEVQRQQAQRQAMAAAYQQAGGNLDVMRELMMANGYDPQVVEQSIAARNTAESATQKVQSEAVDRVRKDNQVFKEVDGKQVVDEEATQAKLDAMRQVFGGSTFMDTAAYEENAPKIKALGGIFDKARGDTNFGLGAYMPWADALQRLSAMPNWKGATLSKASGLKGAFTTGGLEKGHYIIEHNGREMNLGHLDDLQRSLIEEHIKTGKWE